MTLLFILGSFYYKIILFMVLLIGCVFFPADFSNFNSKMHVFLNSWMASVKMKITKNWIFISKAFGHKLRTYYFHQNAKLVHYIHVSNQLDFLFCIHVCIVKYAIVIPRRKFFGGGYRNSLRPSDLPSVRPTFLSGAYL
jgi:hypothetical protein